MEFDAEKEYGYSFRHIADTSGLADMEYEDRRWGLTALCEILGAVKSVSDKNYRARERQREAVNRRIVAEGGKFW